MRPSDAFDGLSRSIMPAGRAPPERSSCSISVSKNCVPFVSGRPVVRTVICAAHCTRRNVVPPSLDTSSMASQPMLWVSVAPIAGSGNPAVKALRRRSRKMTPLANCVCHGARQASMACGGGCSACVKNISSPGSCGAATVTTSYAPISNSVAVPLAPWLGISIGRRSPAMSVAGTLAPAVPVSMAAEPLSRR